MALGLYSFYVREFLASLVSFSTVFLAMEWVVLGAVLTWYDAKQAAYSSMHALRNAITLP